MHPAGSSCFSAISFLLVAIFPFLRLCCFAQPSHPTSALHHASSHPNLSCCAHRADAASIPPRSSALASRASEGPNAETGEEPNLQASEEPDSPKTSHDCPCCTGVYGPFKNDDSWESSRKRSSALPSPSGRRNPLQPKGELAHTRALELSTAATNPEDPLQPEGSELFLCQPPSGPALAILTADTQWLQGPLSRPAHNAPNAALRTLLVAYAAPNAPPVSHRN